MSEFRIASRYAKSLLELASEQGKLEEVNKDMLLFSEVISENRDFQLFLKNPVVAHDKKLTVLNQVFTGKVSDLTLAIFRILVKKQREAYLAAIATEFHHQYNTHTGVEEATVTTTFPIDADLRNEFKAVVKKISGKEVELTEKIDENLIGGFILKVGDRQIDDSINSRLKALKLKFSQNPYVKEF
ncbi:ATP synthase F1 subcomplex delta subunit [Roseivirga ehrenbergii]|uniref:ATP synthase subunit delta n=1 Tax=Roseivirga ehrenbergii (strain DSM 102268 / JCM 13514 / KCTC 12282 / NCIMB 14502 / KMM 6017) TaxID=279360 RepID=A0A150XCC4_ROSEK|nr:ATP synthase F1 subunit delta [Roseivirga ehrenbergii]KYG76336.1 ATP synthase F1 subunit delta [Roseivirga ehrenbergii]TCL00126.1 ATP synthase F1 subcomplex delta subunit [Roseivirga ehrenbergii]